MRISKFSALAILSVSSLAAAASVSAAANSAPKISGALPATTITQPTYFSFRPSATDADGNKLKFSIQNMPAWGTFDPWSGLFRGWISKWYEGREFANIVISVNDGHTTTSLKAFTVKYTKGGATVTNTAPTITGSPATAATAGQAYSFQPSAKDAQGDALAFSIRNKPSWASFSTATGALKGTPTAAGTAGAITVSVSDGKASASLTAFSIQVVAAASGNHAPTIAGSAKGSLQVGETFAFQPNAADADGDALTFSVQNKPAWTSFNTKTGQLTGTPTAADVGTFANVSISVSDGKVASTLSAFAVTVNQVSMGAATVDWTPPTQNTDGSALTGVAGYRIMYGTAAGKYTQTVEIKNAGVTSAMVENLSPATYYFAVKVFTVNGTESELSNSVSKVIN